MFSLIYVSTATPAMIGSDISIMVDRAAEFNASRQITGMLVYNGHNFMQLLEGKRNRIEQLMERIILDSRHKDIVVIRTDEDRPRECPNWSMRSFDVPMVAKGAAEVIFQSFPENFQSDTRIVFTSFASMVKESA